MKLLWSCVAGTLVLAVRAATTNSTKDLAKYVNPFIGTEGPVKGTAFNAGNVFPGATLPFGAVKVGIDTTRFVFLPIDMPFRDIEHDLSN